MEKRRKTEVMISVLFNKIDECFTIWRESNEFTDSERKLDTVYRDLTDFETANELAIQYAEMENSDTIVTLELYTTETKKFS